MELQAERDNPVYYKLETIEHLRMLVESGDRDQALELIDRMLDQQHQQEIWRSLRQLSRLHAEAEPGSARARELERQFAERNAEYL